MTKILEFESSIANHDRIQLPSGVLGQIPNGSKLRVILSVAGAEDEGWRDLAMERFSAAYCDEDDVYEQLLCEPALR